MSKIFSSKVDPKNNRECFATRDSDGTKKFWVGMPIRERVNQTEVTYEMGQDCECLLDASDKSDKRTIDLIFPAGVPHGKCVVVSIPQRCTILAYA